MTDAYSERVQEWLSDALQAHRMYHPGEANGCNRDHCLLASALLSLAAESEELRAENERLKGTNRARFWLLTKLGGR